jgi:hypothetical protein
VTAGFGAPVRLFFLTSTLVYAGLFLRLPLEAGYLIPALPGLCALLTLALPRRVLGVLCAVMLVSCVVLHIDRSAVPDGPGTMRIGQTESIEIHLAGPVLNDLHERRMNACIARAGGAIADTLGNDERLAVGGYLPVMQAMLPPATLEKIVYGARRAPDGGYIVHESGEKLPAGKKFVYLDKAEHFLAITFDAPMARVVSTADCR